MNIGIRLVGVLIFTKDPVNVEVLGEQKHYEVTQGFIV